MQPTYKHVQDAAIRLWIWENIHPPTGFCCAMSVHTIFIFSVFGALDLRGSDGRCQGLCSLRGNRNDIHFLPVAPLQTLFALCQTLVCERHV